MKKLITLKKNREFSRAYTKGKSYVTPVVVVYVLRNRQKEVRIGITTSKKVGNAVERNRARRVIKESCRKLISRIKPGNDLVLVARKRTTQVKSDVVLRTLEKVLKDANLLLDSAPKTVDGEKKWAYDKKVIDKSDKILSKKYFGKKSSVLPILPNVLRVRHTSDRAAWCSEGVISHFF